MGFFLDFSLLLSLALLLLASYPSSVRGIVKECTNSPSQYLTGAEQYEFFRKYGSSWEGEEEGALHSGHGHGGGGGGGGGVVGREDLDWAVFYRNLKYSLSNDTSAMARILKPVSLHHVRLDPTSRHGELQRLDLEFLLSLDVDSLVWSFRKNAGNPAPPGTPYGGWEEPKGELRGHFVGHFLSATALMWASTHNRTIHERMSAVLDVLEECQAKFGTGYLSAFQTEEFDRLEEMRRYVWAPYYTIHKIMAGLLDQYQLAGQKKALRMVSWMADYFADRVANVIVQNSLERHWMTLNTESGGMNDALYRLYSITRDPKHLALAYLFDKPCFLGLLAMRADSLSGFHANTHIPLVVGTQTGYEITGDTLYRDLGIYFIDFLQSSHTYATGGSNWREHWSEPKRLASTLDTENEETCTTYNTLKVLRNLFRYTKGMGYADHYERALTNGILSIQRGNEVGKTLYMLPMGSGQSKAKSHWGWATKNDSFWCCYGTASESFAKLGDSIYFEDEEGDIPSLYIMQYIPSSLHWRAQKSLVKLKVEPFSSWDSRFRASLAVITKKKESQPITLHLRIPFWLDSGDCNIAVNGERLSSASPGTFLSVTRAWKNHDKLTLDAKINMRLEPITDDRPEYSNLQAVLFGPLLLVGLSRGDSSITTGPPHKRLSEYISPIPPSWNSQLFCLSHGPANSTTFLAKRGNSFTMAQPPEPATDSAVDATFRFIPTNSSAAKGSGPEDLIGMTVMLEPFDLPGKLVSGEGPGGTLTLTQKAGKESRFVVVPGMDQQPGSYSLEAKARPGCYVHGGAGGEVGVRCVTEHDGEMADFVAGVSFNLGHGASEYPSVSFVAKGVGRSFLMVPLMALADESYTVYFYISE